jgi:hypothetical protein
MIGARVGKGREPELSNSSKPLKLRGLQEGFDYLLFGRLEGNQAVHWVAKNHRVSVPQ